MLEEYFPFGARPVFRGSLLNFTAVFQNHLKNKVVDLSPNQSQSVETSI